MTKEQIIKAIEILGQYYGFEYDENHHHRIVIYTNIIHDKNGNLIFDSEDERGCEDAASTLLF